jgi:hypothetical protein
MSLLVQGVPPAAFFNAAAVDLQTDSSSAGPQTAQNALTQPGLVQVQHEEAAYYEMPLPQEELPKGPVPAYTWTGASAATLWSAGKAVNATA